MTSVFQSGSHPPCPENFNLTQYVLSKSDKYGSKHALELVTSEGLKTWTYLELSNAIIGMAAMLRSTGLKKNDKVLLRLGNTVNFPITFLACIWAGIVPVPTSAQLTKNEINRIHKIISPKLIIAGKEISLPDAKTKILYEEELRFETYFNKIPADLGTPERLAYIVFTSGTSGDPKGVAHAHRAIWARKMMFEDWYDMSSEDRVLHSGAFNWTYTLGTGLLDPWTLGATSIIFKNSFNPAKFNQLIESNKITIFASSPSTFRQIIKYSKLEKTKLLRHCLSAGEKLPKNIKEDWHKKTSSRIYEAFGMSECSTFISEVPGASNSKNKNSIGKPQQGRKVAVLNKLLIPVPFNHSGRLAIATSDPGCLINYVGEPKLDGDWLVTNDTVKMSKFGEITFLGRADDIINAGGYRVSPIELENLFSSIEGLESVAVIEVTIKVNTSIIALFYKSTHHIDEKVFKEISYKHLARYKQPRLFVRVDSFPVSGNGKLNRKKLKSNYESKIKYKN